MEWKRVFCNPRRLLIIALMAVLCAGLFVISLLDQLSPGELTYLIEANAYAESLVQDWQSVPLEELPALADAELNSLQQFNGWYYGYDPEPVYETEEEAYASIADMPGLLAAAKSGDSYVYSRVWSAYWNAVDTIADEIDYLRGYADYLDGIQKQAQVQSQTSVFGKPGSFSQRNLAKTAADFDTLRGVEVVFGSNRGIERWLSFELGDYFHLLVIVLFVMAFLEERKRGLWPVVRATRGGRARLGVTRIAILFAASALAAVLFQVIPFVLSLGINGGFGSLGRPLQSIVSFKTCTLRISIAGWLVRFLTFKVLAGVLIGLFLWCVLGSISNIQFSLSVLGGILAGEYLLYTLLPVQSAINALKYLNIFAYVHTSKLYTDYLNVNLFNYPVGVRELAVAAMAVMGVVFAVLAVLIQRNRRPEGNRDIIGRISLHFNRILDFFRTRFSMGLWEGYKFLAFGYGVVILLVVLFATGRLNFIFYNTASQDPWYLSYIQDMEGPIDESTDGHLAHARESIPEDAEDAGALMNALSKVEYRVAQLRARAEAGGYAPWILDDGSYDQIYGSQSRNTQRLNAAVAIILTAFCCAGLTSYERQSGVVPMLRATKRGRGGIFRRKIAMVFLITIFVWAAVYMRELTTFLKLCQPQTLSAPVQNIDALAGFPIVLTVIQYLVMLYAVRFVMLLGVGFAVLLISHRSVSVQSACLVSVGILGVPALLTVLGVDALKWVSPLVPVSSAELMWSLGGGHLMYVLPWIVWMAVAGGSIMLSWRKWVR